MRISHSRLGRYRLCPKSYEYRYEKGLQPLLDSVYLVEGRIFHSALASFYRGTPARITRDYEKECSEYLSQVKEFAPKEVDRMRCRLEVLWVVLRRYLKAEADRSRKWSFYKDQVEVKFDVPFGHEHSHNGFIDLLAKRKNRWWIWEHKYIALFDEDLTRELDSQVGTYWMAAEEILGEPPAGVIYNVVKKPYFRLNRFEQWKDASVRIRDKVANQSENSLFRRVEIVRTDKELRYLAKDILDVVHTIESGKRYRNVGSHCKTLCPYMQICGNDDPFLIAESFTQRGGLVDLPDSVEI